MTMTLTSLATNAALLFVESDGDGPPAPNGKWIPHDIKELYWGGTAFLIVMGLLAWKIGPVIKKALNDGQQSAIDEATSADKALAEAQAEEQALIAELGDANAAGERLIAEANQTAAQLRVDQANKTQELVNSMWERAQSEVGSLSSKAGSDLSGAVSSQALTAAEAVVTENLDGATQVELIEDYIRKVGSAS